LFEKQLEDEQEKLRKERTENEEVDFAKWKPQFVIEEAGTDALNELQVKQRDLEIITQIKKKIRYLFWKIWQQNLKSKQQNLLRKYKILKERER